MGLFDTFKKKKPEATPAPEPTTSLQLLFVAPFELDTEVFTRQLRAYDKTLRAATVSNINAGDGSSLCEIKWGNHHVQAVVFGLPMPSEAVEVAVQPAHYGDDVKEQAKAHKAHGLLFYKGSSRNVSEQFVALALVAGAFCGEGAIIVMNETARTSMPAGIFTDETVTDRTDFFRSLPPLFLFAGFVKYFMENAEGIWMRTHGLELWGIPDLATKVDSHEQGSEIFDIFSNIANYMMAQGPVLEAGHTMQVGEDIFMKVSNPTAEQAVMGQPGEVLIAEFIRSDQANSYVFGSENAT